MSTHVPTLDLVCGEDAPDAVCRARLRLRKAEGAHPFTVTDAEFDSFSRYVVMPVPEEGFTLVVHRS